MKNPFKNIILDAPFETDLIIDLQEKTNRPKKSFLEENEKILWEGKPKTSISFFDWKLFSKFDSSDLGKKWKVIILFSSIFLAFNSLMVHYFFKSFFPGTLFNLAFFIWICLPHLAIYKNRINTKYFLTNKKLIFRLRKSGKSTTHIIYLNQIKKIGFEINKLNSELGSIGFLLKDKFYAEFQTRDFHEYKKRINPTFEMIKNPKEIFNLISKTKKAIKNEKRNTR